MLSLGSLEFAQTLGHDRQGGTYQSQPNNPGTGTTSKTNTTPLPQNT